MSDWPKKRLTIVGPDDRAPEPVAWAIKDRATGTLWWFEGSGAAAARKAELYRDELVPLFLTHPTESAIRASERERVAELVDGLGPEIDSPDLGRIAAAIRELGDE